MPIKIPQLLPAREILEKEKIFIMDEDRAASQDIRPLNILILNLMPEKEKTEAQLLRLLGNTSLQVNVSFLKTTTYKSKNTSQYHLEQFYQEFAEIKDKKFDGMIITGAPVEHLRFEEVIYWEELTEIMEWTKSNVTSTLHICWGSQAALYYHFGIGKYPLSQKRSGVYSHTVIEPEEKLLRGFDDVYLAPHSRHTDVDIEEINRCSALTLLSASEEAGPFIISAENGKQIMITGHLEYDSSTLAEEFERDIQKGMEIPMPEHYFPNDNPKNVPLNRWRSHAHLLFSNWLNYYVYQQTPYEWR
ncbi:homoserine O-acetyltransferase MetA [Priestia abyssalis]|uniref:homoserine O-acetyltransferase MetA n=1 Tax=Priestia abyssalis TaxID=1221450 RepID=UPI0009954119|nr:homoserine O-succinyltransferase [Priestia abyssalis]